MKATSNICDRCGEPIDGRSVDFGVHEGTNIKFAALGSGELCELKYQGIMGHNKFPLEGFQYHYACFSVIVDEIVKLNKCLKLS